MRVNLPRLQAVRPTNRYLVSVLEYHNDSLAMAYNCHPVHVRVHELDDQNMDTYLHNTGPKGKFHPSPHPTRIHSLRLAL